MAKKTTLTAQEFQNGDEDVGKAVRVPGRKRLEAASAVSGDATLGSKPS
jgi:hypothetical protein